MIHWTSQSFLEQSRSFHGEHNVITERSLLRNFAFRGVDKENKSKSNSRRIALRHLFNSPAARYSRSVDRGSWQTRLTMTAGTHTTCGSYTCAKIQLYYQRQTSWGTMGYSYGLSSGLSLSSWGSESVDSCFSWTRCTRVIVSWPSFLRRRSLSSSADITQSSLYRQSINNLHALYTCMVTGVCKVRGTVKRRGQVSSARATRARKLARSSSNAFRVVPKSLCQVNISLQQIPSQGTQWSADRIDIKERQLGSC